MRFVAIAFLLAASATHAENWQQIAPLDSTGSVVFFDAASITEVKGLRRAWIKAEYTSDQPVPEQYLESVPKDLRSFRSERSVRYFNCTQRTSATMKHYWDAADGKPGGYAYDPLLTFRAVPPGTLDEKMLEAVCNFAGELASAEAAKLLLPGVNAARMTRPVSPEEYYPSGSRHRGEKGSPVVKACVGPDGKLVREPEIMERSGFPELDAAAIKVAKATRYAPGLDNGKPVAESCLMFKVNFGIYADPRR